MLSFKFLCTKAEIYRYTSSKDIVTKTKETEDIQNRLTEGSLYRITRKHTFKK